MREMRQTRHSFATNALIYGDPLCIAKVMGHRNTNMIINVMKLIEDAKGTTDGSLLAKAEAARPTAVKNHEAIRFVRIWAKFGQNNEA